MFLISQIHILYFGWQSICNVTSPFVSQLGAAASSIIDIYAHAEQKRSSLSLPIPSLIHQSSSPVPWELGIDDETLLLPDNVEYSEKTEPDSHCV